MKLTAPGGGADLRWSSRAAARRQGAPRRRSRRAWSWREQQTRRRTLPKRCVSITKHCRGRGCGGRARARRANDLAGSAGQRSGRYGVRRCRRNRSGIRRGGSRDPDGLRHRPRDRGADGAASGARRNTIRRPIATRYGPAAAARCARNTSSRRCSALHRSGCAFSPSTSAAISDRATASTWSSAWCCGPRSKLGRPVKYTATRSEAFLSDYQGRDLKTKVALALRSDGRFLAMRADNISNVGALLRVALAAQQGRGAHHRLL